MQLFKGINVVSISVSDLARAKSFYSDLLGLGAPLYDMPEIGWIEWRTGNDANSPSPWSPRPSPSASRPSLSSMSIAVTTPSQPCVNGASAATSLSASLVSSPTPPFMTPTATTSGCAAHHRRHKTVT